MNRSAEEFVSEICCNVSREPVFEKIKRDKYPIFIWGTGALAKGVNNYCSFYHINVEGFFVNVAAEQKELQGMNIYTLDAVLQKYQYFSVIIGHSNYADGITFLKSIQQCRNVYYLASVCYDMWNPIDMSFIYKNVDNLKDIYCSLDDELSREILLSYIVARRDDKAEYMFQYYDKNCNYFNNDVISIGANEVLLDVGACVGSAIWSFVERTKGEYGKIIAFEPDEKSYSFLQEEIRRRKLDRVLTYRKCIYSNSEPVKFSGSGERGGIGSLSSESHMIEATTIDSINANCNGAEISIIKINFPFAVKDVLKGGTELLKLRKPKLIIRVGFDENILLEAFNEIKRINSEYRFYFRYTVGMPQGLTLFAI